MRSGTDCAELDKIDARFDEIDTRFREQEENFRRLSDVAVERIEALVRPVIEAHEHLATVTGNPRSPAPGHREAFLIIEARGISLFLEWR